MFLIPVQISDRFHFGPGKLDVYKRQVFMYGAIPLAILFAAAAHQFTQRLDLSLALFAAFAGLSLTVWREQWQLCWLNPCVWAVSDDFTNIRLLRSVGYVRLTWALALMGLWGLSYLCVRRYGKAVSYTHLDVYKRQILIIVLVNALAKKTTSIGLW